ncbi:uncharacterized protein LOC122316123 [Carya illinoinensis]|uniref:uncharacterized protein LOC122316123 n=1 Tax=Carya illinoinensis TaxID=32201 RepID=UPI001C71EAC6|nr:uncharacterized protein LOC122316123 [Carya illinoinensis]
MASTQSSSSVVDEFVLETPSCWCGLKAPLKTSHTTKNPGRKFFACPNYKTLETRKCEFFIWADIFHLVEENIRRRESQVWNMLDDVLVHEKEVRKKEDKVRKKEDKVRGFVGKIINYYVCIGL